MADYIPPTAHWRDSARTVRLFVMDYRATFPLLLTLFFPRISTLIIMVIAVVFFAALERYGFTVNVFLRLFRATLGGPRRHARPWWVKEVNR